jgi:hypothetical protein
MSKKAKSTKKQPDLPAMSGPGVAQPHLPKIDEKAAEFVEARDKRLAAAEKEKRLMDELATVVHAHADKLGVNPKGEIIYRFDNLIVIVKPGKEKVAVKPFDKDDESED